MHTDKLHAEILTNANGPYAGVDTLLPLLCDKEAMVKLQALLVGSGMRFNSQYPIFLACVKAVGFVWAEAREKEPTVAAPPSLFFLQAVTNWSQNKKQRGGAQALKDAQRERRIETTVNLEESQEVVFFFTFC
jgi:hypothetical protein